MLTLLNHDKSFIPAKRLYERKPLASLAFKEDKLIHIFEICNN